MSTGLDEHRLRRLLDVGRGLVSELDREAVLRQLLEVARELTGARYAALGILDTTRNELERFLVLGIDEEVHRAIGDLPTGRGVLGELIREPKALRLRDISEHPRSYGFPPAHPSMTTFLGVPISIRGEVWGNIYLTEKDQGEFDERDEEALIVLAEWAGIAIDNARLYEHVEGRREELERAVRSLEATTAIAQAVGGETNLQRVLELVVKRARALVSARSLLILLADEEELRVAAVAGEARSALVGSRVSRADSVLGHVLRTGHVERLGDVGARMRLGLGELAEDVSTAMLVPLSLRGKTGGVLLALDRVGDRGEFDDEDERLMRSFAASAATAVATAQSVSAEQLRRSIDAAESERGRWARELHDETLQGLGALQMLFTSAQRKGTPEAGRQAAVTAVGQIADEIEKLQSLITELRPSILDDIGLGPALSNLLSRTRSMSALEITATIDLAFDSGRRKTRLTPEAESSAYRIVQEALTNVAKHAGARRVEVSVIESDDRLRITVADDGRGFEPRLDSGRFGLVGMRERVELIGGRLAIESAAGEGATIRAELPAAHLVELPSSVPRSA